MTFSNVIITVLHIHCYYHLLENPCNVLHILFIKISYAIRCMSYAIKKVSFEGTQWLTYAANKNYVRSTTSKQSDWRSEFYTYMYCWLHWPQKSSIILKPKLGLKNMYLELMWFHYPLVSSSQMLSKSLCRRGEKHNHVY